MGLEGLATVPSTLDGAGRTGWGLGCAALVGCGGLTSGDRVRPAGQSRARPCANRAGGRFSWVNVARAGAPAGGQAPGKAHVTPPYLATFPSPGHTERLGRGDPFLTLLSRQPSIPPTTLSGASVGGIWGKEVAPGSLRASGWWGLDLGG